MTDALVAALTAAFEKHGPDAWGEGPLSDFIEDHLAAAGYSVQPAAQARAAALAEVARKVRELQPRMFGATGDASRNAYVDFDVVLALVEQDR